MLNNKKGDESINLKFSFDTKIRNNFYYDTYVSFTSVTLSKNAISHKNTQKF